VRSHAQLTHDTKRSAAGRLRYLAGARLQRRFGKVGFVTKRTEEGGYGEGVLPRSSALDRAYALGEPTR
jgi:hypothetical protein